MKTNQNNNTVETCQDTKESPGDLMRLDVTQTLGENHQLMLARKTLKGVQ